MFKSLRRTLILCLCLAIPFSIFGETVTPKPGSADRKEICDAVRDFAFEKFEIKTLSEPVVFTVSFIKIDGNYAGFEGSAHYADGRGVDELLISEFTVLLKKKNGDWTVSYDLSRSDVPDDDEVARINLEISKATPPSIIPPYWRELLNR